MSTSGCARCGAKWRDLKVEIAKAERLLGQGRPVMNLDRIADLRIEITQCEHAKQTD